MRIRHLPSQSKSPRAGWALSGAGCPPPAYKTEVTVPKLTEDYLLYKIFQTLRPFYDFRVLLLLCVCFGVGWLVDPIATMGLASYMCYVIGMAGAALALVKVLMPYLRISRYARSAIDEGNVAAALIVLAYSILLLGVLALLVIWGK